MKNIIEIAKQKAQQDLQRIVFPEGEESRIMATANAVYDQKIAKVILVGRQSEILSKAQEMNLAKLIEGINNGEIQVEDPANSDKTEHYAQRFLELRKSKGVTEDQAHKTMLEINYFGCMMVNEGDADGMVSGTTFPTADTIRPALQIIKTKEKFHKVSGVFFMTLEDRLLLFADCAVTIEPNSRELAEIAIDTAETATHFGLTPRIAMLSFSTHGSAKHPYVDKVKEATEIVKHLRPNLAIEGEMQVDAALVPEVCAKKFPGSKIQGDANVLIFPSLEAGNIAYKLVERLAGAQAIGPVLQGLNKPVNDLSRGCSVEDIVNLTAITACEAQEGETNYF